MSSPLTTPSYVSREKVEARGKAFVRDGAPFAIRGLRPSCLIRPGRTPADALAADLTQAAAAGYNVISLPAREELIAPAAASGLACLLEFDVDLLGLATGSRRARRREVRDAAVRVRSAIAAWGRSANVIGVCLDATVAAATATRDGVERRTAEHLVREVRGSVPGLLLAWRTTDPSLTGCPPDCDFLIVDLSGGGPELASAVLAAHTFVGDRPLVLGDAVAAMKEAPDALASHTGAAIRGGAAGTILTGSPPASAEPARETRRHLERTVHDLAAPWPTISVVVCAHNAERTLDECLEHCTRLDYPGLELIVVDDGSTDSTAQIARRHGVRCLSRPHAGLSAARNAGYRAAGGEIVAYLDADAYPSPDWPWFLALAALDGEVAGCGGPNVPPGDDPAGARAVARSPGGPVPQLLSPSRARHLPGCNMAFRRRVLEELGGFDDRFTSNTDDVEFEQRVADRGLELGYHPAALVWHHRRPGMRAYLRQQRHYGYGQATLECRFPDRFPRGYRVRQARSRLLGRPDGRGTGDSLPVEYVALAPAPVDRLDLCHQWGVPAAAALVGLAPFARRLRIPAAVGAGAVAGLFVVDLVMAGRGATRPDRAPRARATVAVLRIMRPLAFRWGHLRGRVEIGLRSTPPPPAPVSESAAAGEHRR